MIQPSFIITGLGILGKVGKMILGLTKLDKLGIWRLEIFFKGWENVQILKNIKNL